MKRYSFRHPFGFLFLFFTDRFDYTNYDKRYKAIHEFIEALDKMGMDIIETGEPDAFKQYLQETDNTICGRHPIAVFLHVRVSTLSLPIWLASKRVLK